MTDTDTQLNVLGFPIETCSMNPLTGFLRTGSCETCAEDIGSHTVCVQLTGEFLAFSQRKGNDLSTPRPEFGFPGLTDGDFWGLCAARWQEALEAGCAPRVRLRSTHQSALEIIELGDLKTYAIDLN